MKRVNDESKMINQELLTVILDWYTGRGYCRGRGAWTAESALDKAVSMHVRMTPATFAGEL